MVDAHDAELVRLFYILWNFIVNAGRAGIEGDHGFAIGDERLLIYDLEYAFFVMMSGHHGNHCKCNLAKFFISFNTDVVFYVLRSDTFGK